MVESSTDKKSTTANDDIAHLKKPDGGANGGLAGRKPRNNEGKDVEQ